MAMLRKFLKNVLQTMGSFGSLRRASNRTNCINILDVIPRCDPCHPDIVACQKEQKKKREEIGKFPFAHLLLLPECCDDPCKDMFARFDDLYYEPSDKKKKCYKRTWNECKSPLWVPKVTCYPDKNPPFERRCRADMHKPKGLACEVNKKSILSQILRKCHDHSQSVCPTLQMPCCTASRKPPKCKIMPSPSNCCRICAPYPSFSECDRPPFNPKPKKECDCLARVDLCTLYDLMRKGLVNPPKRFRIY